MKLSRIIVSLALVLLLALLVVRPVSAQALVGDQIVTGGNFTLASDQVLTGSLLVFGGSALLEAGSVVEGDVVMFGGSLSSAGVVEGSLALIGGSAQLQASTVIEGDAISLGGSLARQPGAQVQGQLVTASELPLRLPEISLPALRGELPRLEVGLQPLLDAFWFLFRTFLLAALGVLVVIFFPNATKRTANAALAQPLVSGGLGVLTLIVMPVLLVVLAVTIILIPVSLAGFLALGVALFFGWIAIGYELGERLAHNTHQTWAPAVSAGVGVFLVSLLAWGAAEFVACIGWIVPWVVFSAGLGAVILSRFGTAEYAPAGAAAGVVAAPVTVAPLRPAAPAAVAEPVSDLPADEPAATADENPDMGWRPGTNLGWQEGIDLSGPQSPGAPPAHDDAPASDMTPKPDA